MHACALAKELGIKRVVIPSLSGVLSAWGMLLSDLRRDYLQTQIVALSASDAAEQINDAFAALEEQAYQEYEAENIDRSRIRFMRYGRLRYQNQEHSTEIDLPGGEITPASMHDIIEHFHTNYEREYTYRLDAPVEFVTYHLIAFAEVDKLKPQKLPLNENSIDDAVKGRREVDFLSDDVHLATVFSGDALAPGMRFSGPAIIEEAEATVVISPDVKCQVDEYGNYQLLMAQGGSNG
jgi:N-methylhydantoinase A